MIHCKGGMGVSPVRVANSKDNAHCKRTFSEGTTHKMNALQNRFEIYQTTGQRCVVPYITAAYPDLATTIAIAAQLTHDSIGALELGIPFSDPIADGPVIQTSFARALESGFSTKALFATLAQNADKIQVPIVAMVSGSVVFRNGAADFVKQAVDAGIAGFIVPDVALEEAQQLADTTEKAGASLVLLVAPNTPTERRDAIAKFSNPFVYYQAIAGITGERAAIAADLATNVSAIRTESGKPVCAGFGIGNAEQVQSVCNSADGAIVGTAIVRKMNDAIDRGESAAQLVDDVVAFINELADAAATANAVT